VDHIGEKAQHCEPREHPPHQKVVEGVEPCALLWQPAVLVYSIIGILGTSDKFVVVRLAQIVDFGLRHGSGGSKELLAVAIFFYFNRRLQLLGLHRLLVVVVETDIFIAGATVRLMLL